MASLEVPQVIAQPYPGTAVQAKWRFVTWLARQNPWVFWKSNFELLIARKFEFLGWLEDLCCQVIGFNWGAMSVVVDVDVDAETGPAGGPGSREWAAARKRSKDSVLKWDFAALLEAEVCNEKGFQAQLKDAYMYAKTQFQTPVDAKGEGCVSLTPDAVARKLPGPVSWLLMFSSVMMLLLIDFNHQSFKVFLDKSPSKAPVVLSNYRARILQFVRWWGDYRRQFWLACLRRAGVWVDLPQEDSGLPEHVGQTASVFEDDVWPADLGKFWRSWLHEAIRRAYQNVVGRRASRQW